jgi:tRNA(His) 5'-end guanylyltransferase
MKKDSIGNRMKQNYENIYRISLTRRTPVIIRLDGRAFHTFTKHLEKPFSNMLREAMVKTAEALLSEISGAKIAYVQSDEISILVTDYDHLYTQPWFDYNLQKITSVSASIATAVFNDYMESPYLATFDSRAFNIPKEEVANYFLWRWQDWKRNSIQLLGQSLFSHKELHKKNQREIVEMCNEKGEEWEYLAAWWKYGTFIDAEFNEAHLDFSLRETRDRFDTQYVYIDNKGEGYE